MNLMALLGRQYIGLYINPDFIEVAVVRKEFKHVHISQVIRKNISTQDVELSDQNEIIRNVIEDIFHEHKLPRSNVSLNLPTHDVILRTFKMPRLPEEDWASAVRFEGQKHVPFKLNEMVSDFCVLDPEEETPDMNVLFVCTRSSAVSRYVSILTALNINCKSLNSVFISMVKMAYYAGVLSDNVPSLLISVKKKVFGRERVRCFADLVVTHNDVPIVARDVSVLGNQEDIDEKFFNELYLSIKLFNSSLGNQNIERVIFFEGDELYRWDEFFGENFSATVETFDISSKYEIEKTDGISLGAAMSSLMLPHVSINLLGAAPVDDITQKNPFPIKFVAIAEGVIATLLLLFMFISYQPKIAAIDREIAEMTASAGQFASETEQSLQGKKKNFQGLIKTLKSYRQDKRPGLDQVIQVLQSHMQKNMWVEQIIYNNEEPDVLKMTVLGVAYNRDRVQDMITINEFKKQCEDNALFQKFMPIIQVIKTENFEYEDSIFTRFSLSFLNGAKSKR